MTFVLRSWYQLIYDQNIKDTYDDDPERIQDLLVEEEGYNLGTEFSAIYGDGLFSKREVDTGEHGNQDEIVYECDVDFSNTYPIQYDYDSNTQKRRKLRKIGYINAAILRMNALAIERRKVKNLLNDPNYIQLPDLTYDPAYIQTISTTNKGVQFDPKVYIKRYLNKYTWIEKENNSNALRLTTNQAVESRNSEKQDHKWTSLQYEQEVSEYKRDPLNYTGLLNKE